MVVNFKRQLNRHNSTVYGYSIRNNFALYDLIHCFDFDCMCYNTHASLCAYDSSRLFAACNTNVRCNIVILFAQFYGLIAFSTDLLQPIWSRLIFPNVFIDVLFEVECDIFLKIYAQLNKWSKFKALTWTHRVRWQVLPLNESTGFFSFVRWLLGISLVFVLIRRKLPTRIMKIPSFYYSNSLLLLYLKITSSFQIRET